MCAYETSRRAEWTGLAPGLEASPEPKNEAATVAVGYRRSGEGGVRGLVSRHVFLESPERAQKALKYWSEPYERFKTSCVPSCAFLVVRYSARNSTRRPRTGVCVRVCVRALYIVHSPR